jgi:hypothetical protein
MRLLFIFLVLISTFSYSITKGQDSNKSIIDTLNIKNDSVFVRISSYIDDTIRSVATGFIMRDTIVWHRHLIFKKKIPITELLLHGDQFEYYSNLKKYSRYEFGYLIESKYYDLKLLSPRDTCCVTKISIGPVTNDGREYIRLFVHE